MNILFESVPAKNISVEAKLAASNTFQPQPKDVLQLKTNHKETPFILNLQSCSSILTIGPHDKTLFNMIYFVKYLS